MSELQPRCVGGWGCGGVQCHRASKWGWEGREERVAHSLHHASCTYKGPQEPLAVRTVGAALWELLLHTTSVLAVVSTSTRLSALWHCRAYSLRSKPSGLHWGLLAVCLCSCSTAVACAASHTAGCVGVAWYHQLCMGALARLCWFLDLASSWHLPVTSVTLVGWTEASKSKRAVHGLEGAAIVCGVNVDVKYTMRPGCVLHMFAHPASSLSPRQHSAAVPHGSPTPGCVGRTIQTAGVAVLRHNHCATELHKKN